MTPPTRTGRPPLSNPRNVNIQIRCTPDEKATLTTAAEAAGLPLAEWMRQTALRAAKRARPTR